MTEGVAEKVVGMMVVAERALGMLVVVGVSAVGRLAPLVDMKVVAVLAAVRVTGAAATGAAALRVTVEAATVTEEETAVQVPRQTQGEAVAGS